LKHGVALKPEKRWLEKVKEEERREKIKRVLYIAWLYPTVYGR